MGFGMHYSVQTGETEHNELTIRPDGVVTAWITHSIPGSPIRALGHFYLQANANDTDLVELERLAREKGLIGGSPRRVSPRYGERLTLFEFNVDGKTVQHQADAMSPLSEPLKSMEDRIEPLLRRLSTGAAQRAVSFWLDFEPKQLRPGDNLRVYVNVTNGGSLPAEIRNFAGFRRHGPDILKINMWTPATTDRGDPVYTWELDLSQREWLVADRKSLRSKDSTIRLPPAGTMRAWTDCRFPKTTPGALRAELVYYAHAESATEEENNDFLVGEFHADPVNFLVLPLNTP